MRDFFKGIFYGILLLLLVHMCLAYWNIFRNQYVGKLHLVALDRKRMTMEIPVKKRNRDFPPGNVTVLYAKEGVFSLIHVPEENLLYLIRDWMAMGGYIPWRCYYDIADPKVAERLRDELKTLPLLKPEE